VRTDYEPRTSVAHGQHVFDTKPIAFAVRDPLPGVDLNAIKQAGEGIAVWLHAPDAQQIHDALAADSHPIVTEPCDGPFGRTFTFADPDGYRITLHTSS
jgi:predicted enzyme related to lactoylglutathione lyase